MNKLKGQIQNIQKSGNLLMITVELLHGEKIKAIIIKSSEPSPHIEIGSTTNILFKETEVIIGTQKMQGISIENQLTGKVSKIDTGVLLSKIEIESSAGLIKSIISTEALEKLKIAITEEVTLFIKMNEIMLAQ